ncbi:MAG TPA: cell envelope biogenesis protein OmpA [Thiomicrospira sp.]|nr:cell envelope biogenesis protein OmpA [Thiomicrospira sp.]
MSLLLLRQIKNNSNQTFESFQPENNTVNELEFFKRNRLWLMTYIALFTSLLAFFVLMISMVELEGSTPKRNYQKLVHQLYKETSFVAKQQGLPWLKIENTLTKGIKISLPSDLIQNSALFASARAKINPRYLPYLQSIAEVINALNIKDITHRHQKLIKGIAPNGSQVKFIIRIEGHTDSSPLAKTARFKNNVELSTFRAYAMMDWLRIHTGLPRSYFSIAGYGSFHPLTNNSLDSKNRRIEIYLTPRIAPLIKQDSVQQVRK